MKSNRAWRWITLAPALVLFAGVAILPTFNLVAMSFYDIVWHLGKAEWQWVGLSNYLRVPKDNLFGAGIGNTLIFAGVSVAVQMALGFALALATTKVRRARAFYRAVFILPILVPGIVIGAIWKLMYNFDFGVINQILTWFSLPVADWLGSTTLALPAVIVVDVWHWTPFVFLLMLTGLESLPEDVFEAARIDGATFWQELRFVTLPLMLPTIAVTFVFRLIVGFKVFEEIYLLTGGGPGTSTEVLSFTIYRRFFTEGLTGYGSAMSVVVLCVLALVIVLAQSFSRRWEAVS